MISNYMVSNFVNLCHILRFTNNIFLRFNEILLDLFIFFLFYEKTKID